MSSNPKTASAAVLKCCYLKNYSNAKIKKVICSSYYCKTVELSWLKKKNKVSNALHKLCTNQIYIILFYFHISTPYKATQSQSSNTESMQLIYSIFLVLNMYRKCKS